MNDERSAREANARGLACLQSDDHEGAARAFAQATAADPGAGLLWRNLAHAHRLGANDEGERTALGHALALDRTDFAAQLRLAQLHQRLGEEVSAMQAWDIALRLGQQLPDLSPELIETLGKGEAYCGLLRDKIAVATDSVLTPAQGDYSDTEQRRLGAFVDMALGKRRVFHNSCAGAHYPFLPEDEFFDRSLFPSFTQLEAAAPDVRAELEALLAAGDDVLRPYVRMEEGLPENTWSDLDGSLDWAACFLWEYGVPNSPVLDRCPKTAALLDALPLARIEGRAPNAFFSLLKPGSRIPPHTGVTNTRAIVHLALDVPPSCGFRVGNEIREWVEGQAFAFDDTIEHEAWNDSDRRRAVLIVDYWNPHLTPNECDAIARYFTEADRALRR